MGDKPKRDQVNVRLLPADRRALDRIKRQLSTKAKKAGLDTNISDSVALRYCILATHDTEAVEEGRATT